MNASVPKVLSKTVENARNVPPWIIDAKQQKYPILLKQFNMEEASLLINQTDLPLSLILVIHHNII